LNCAFTAQLISRSSYSRFSASDFSRNHPVRLLRMLRKRLSHNEHADVLRDVDKMLEELGISMAEFSAMYKSENGQSYEVLNLPKREVMILVSGRIVENMGLDWPGQYTKLLSQRAKFSCCDISTTGTDGKTYEMLAMPADKLQLC
jgi:antirepressor protein